jgi:hypothetical protein
MTGDEPERLRGDYWPQPDQAQRMSELLKQCRAEVQRRRATEAQPRPALRLVWSREGPEGRRIQMGSSGMQWLSPIAHLEL